MRPVLAIGGAALICVGAAVAVGAWWQHSVTADAQVTEQFDMVRLNLDSGSVSIQTGDVVTTSVHEVMHYRWNHPDHAYSLDGRALVLGDCGTGCSVDYTVVIPRNISVTGSADSGDITVSGVPSVDIRTSSGTMAVRDVSGTVHAKADSGDVTLADIGGDATVQADSGTVDCSGLHGNTQVQADSGDITLTMATMANVRAAADSGTVRLTVPRAAYRFEGGAGSGTRSINVPTDPTSPHVLDLQADSGDVTVNSA